MTCSAVHDLSRHVTWTGADVSVILALDRESSCLAAGARDSPRAGGEPLNSHTRVEYVAAST